MWSLEKRHNERPAGHHTQREPRRARRLPSSTRSVQPSEKWQDYGRNLRPLLELLRGRATLLDAAAHPGPLPRRKPPERDKAGGRSFVEGTIRVVGGELLTVES